MFLGLRMLPGSFCAERALTTMYELSLVCVRVLLLPRIVRQLGRLIRIFPHSIRFYERKQTSAIFMRSGSSTVFAVSNRKPFPFDRRRKSRTTMMPQLSRQSAAE